MRGAPECAKLWRLADDAVLHSQTFAEAVSTPQNWNSSANTNGEAPKAQSAMTR